MKSSDQVYTKSAVFKIKNGKFGKVFLQINFNFKQLKQKLKTNGRLALSKTSNVKTGSCNAKGLGGCCLSPVKEMVKIEMSPDKKYITFMFLSKEKRYKQYATELRLKKVNGKYISDNEFNSCRRIASKHEDKKFKLWYVYVVSRVFDKDFFKTDSSNIDPYFARMCDTTNPEETVEKTDQKVTLKGFLAN